MPTPVLTPCRLAALLVLTTFSLHAATPPAQQTASVATAASTPELDVDYVPTPMPSVRRMLDLAGVGPDDHLVDLGSGDGRILITAARKYQVRSALGIELDPWLVQYATAEALKAGVADRVRFVEADLFETDFANADVVTMYLLPELNLRLRPYMLTRLSPGTRIVSHSFDMGDWQPDAQSEMYTKPIYMWVVPARVDGTWDIELNREGPPIVLTLGQQFQNITGAATYNGKPLQLNGLQLRGRNIQFSIDGDLFEGRINGRTMESTGTMPWFALSR